MAFGCPMLALVEQVAATGSAVNEYGIEMSSPKFGAPKLIDVYAGPFPDNPGLIILMMQQFGQMLQDH